MFLVTEGLGRGWYYHTDTFMWRTAPLVTSCGWEQVKGTNTLSLHISIPLRLTPTNRAADFFWDESF